MKTFRIDAETVDYFRGLDPFETLDRLIMKDSFILGATTSQEDESSDKEEPTGLMVCTIEDDRLVLQWLFVVPEYREMGLGSYLLMLAFEEADRRNLAQVAVRISDEYDKNDPSWDSWGFFVNDIFKQADAEGSVWRTSMKDMTVFLEKYRRINENSAKATGLIPLEDLSGAELAKAVEELNRSFAVNMDQSVEKLIYSADPKMSFVKKKKDDYVGIILMRMGSRTWYMDALFTGEPEDEEILFRAALYHCEDRVRLSDNLEIEVKMQSVDSLMEEMKMPGSKYTVNYLTASVKDFRTMKKNAKTE